MSRLFWLTDAQWAVIEPHLPSNQPGARRVDDRRVISGIIQGLKIRLPLVRLSWLSTVLPRRSTTGSTAGRGGGSGRNW